MCCGWCRIPKRSMFVVLAFVRRTHTYLPFPLFSIKAASMAFSKASLDYTYILFLIHYIFYELWEDDLTEISYYLFSFSFLAIPHLHSWCKRKLYCMSVILFAGNCSKKVRGSKLGLQQNKCLSAEVLLPWFGIK